MTCRHTDVFDVMQANKEVSVVANGHWQMHFHSTSGHQDSLSPVPVVSQGRPITGIHCEQVLQEFSKVMVYSLVQRSIIVQGLAFESRGIEIDRRKHAFFGEELQVKHKTSDSGPNPWYSI